MAFEAIESLINQISTQETITQQLAEARLEELSQFFQTLLGM